MIWDKFGGDGGGWEDDVVYEDKRRAFLGETYDPDRDFERLTNNRIRVYVRMLDGEWHRATEIRDVGGSEGLRRLRELESRDWGPIPYDKRPVAGGKSGLYEYRLHTGAVTQEIHDRIMSGKRRKPDRAEVDRLARIHNALKSATDETLLEIEKILHIVGEPSVNVLDLSDVF